MSAERAPRSRLRVVDGEDDAAVPLRRVLKQRRTVSGWRSLLRLAAGIGCLLLGVIGLFVPVLQGILLLAFGAALLAPDFPPARRLMVRTYRRWPRLRRRVPRGLRRLGRPSAEDCDETGRGSA